VTLPGLAIFLTALSLNLLASSLRAVTDPVQRERWLSFEPGRARERGR
jgi:ABC-type dipeptide/oligopeptide/nickel transport system permease subunit